MNLLPFLALLIQQPATDPPKLQSYDLVANDQLSVRLKVLAEATMFDAGWIKLEFENHTNNPLSVHFQCSATMTAARPGNSVPLFQQFADSDFAQKNAAGRGGSLAALPPGVTVLGEDLLAAAIANTLRSPPEKGQRVEARMRCVANVLRSGPGKKGTTPGDGVAFAFTWKRAESEPFKKAREELTRLLVTTPVERTAAYRQRLQFLLGVSDLHADLSIDTVLTALPRFSADHRVDVYRALVIPRRSDPKIVAYYRDRIKAGDEAALYDLLNGEWRPIRGMARSEEVSLWDQSFTEPMVALCEQDLQKNQMAFSVLLKRTKEWSGDPKITARLAVAVRKQYPVMEKDLGQLDAKDVEQLMWGISRLGSTRDRASLAWLQKVLALDLKTTIPAPMIFIPSRPTGESVAHQAAMAVAEILDGDQVAMVAWVRKRNPNANPTGDNAIAYAKDRLSRWEAEQSKPK